MKGSNLKSRVAATFLLLSLSACGYKGALVLPEKSPEARPKPAADAVKSANDAAKKS